jgi:exosortase
MPTRGEIRARRASPDFKPALGLGVSLLSLGLACRELLRFQPETQMVVSPARNVEEFFFEPSDSSPLLVLVFCGWLAWRRRKRLARLWGLRGPLAWTGGLWGVATALFAWSVRFGAPELQALALVPALLGAVNLLGGRAALRVVALPAATLLFAVPPPAALMNEILWHLQIFAADFTGLVLGAFGLPVLVSGDRIFLSGSVFAIIETCSGVRSIETLGMLTIMLVELFGRRGRHAVLLLLAAPLLALLVNGFRCVGPTTEGSLRTMP